MTSAGSLAVFLHTLSAASVLAAASVRCWRIVRFPLAVLLALVLTPAFYTVASKGLLFRFARPVILHGENFVMRPRQAPVLSTLQRGDWIVYRPDSFHVGAAMTCERVLAFRGETIRFHPAAFEVEGILYQRISDLMPKAGEVIVPPGACYVWPSVIRIGHAGGQEERLLQKLAMVAETHIIGIPYRHWFGRAQTFEPLTPVDPASLPASPP